MCRMFCGVFKMVLLVDDGCCILNMGVNSLKVACASGG